MNYTQIAPILRLTRSEEEICIFELVFSLDSVKTQRYD
jgi:hypothetical protein